MNEDNLRAALKRVAHLPLRPENYHEVELAAGVRRRRRRVVSFVAVGAVFILSAGTALGVSALLSKSSSTNPGRAAEGTTPATPPATTPSASRAGTVANELRVRGHPVGANERFTVTFIDGTVLELTVPAGSGLDAMPIQPYGGARIPGVADRDFVVPIGGMAWFAAIGTKTRELTRTDTKVVSLWSVTGHGPSRYLVFDFGAWVVGVWDGAGGATMSDDQLQMWADNLDGRTTPDGFLVLTTTKPLELYRPGSGAPPTLNWGTEDGSGLTLQRAPCATAVKDVTGTDTERRATLCQPAWGTHIVIHGPPSFVNALINDLTAQRHT